MSDPLNPETYGPPVEIKPGTELHCTGPTRIAAGAWTLHGGYLERPDGARVYFRGYPVYVDGSADLGYQPLAVRGGQP